MIEINPIERVDMTSRIDQIRRRMMEIEDKIGINDDFQAALDREIAKQTAIAAAAPAQKTTQKPAAVQKVDNAVNQPVNENDVVNSAKVAQSLREAEKIENNSAQRTLPGDEALPGNYSKLQQPQIPQQSQHVEQTPSKIEKIEMPDTEFKIPERDDKIFEDNYNGEDAEQIPIEDIIMQTAAEYGVDPKLVKAIAIAESNMNQEAISPVGAVGVMQLMPETAEDLGVDPYDKSDNIVGGTRYIRQMLDTFDGNVPLAVAAYNAGPGAVKRYGGIPPYSETKNYVGKVMDLYQ